MKKYGVVLALLGLAWATIEAVPLLALGLLGCALVGVCR